MFRRLLIVITAATLLAAIALGLGGCGSNPTNPLTVAVCDDDDVVAICVSTTFSLFVDGVPWPNGVQNDFTVDERPDAGASWESRPVCCFTPPAQGGAGTASVAMVLDRSGSMSGQKTTDLNEAAHLFVNLMRVNDRTEIIDFDSNVTVPQPFTSDKGALNTAIDAGVPGGSTAAWDAASQGLTDLGPETSDVRAVLLMTDGEDNSSALSRAALILQAVTAGFPIYAVAFQAPAQAEADLQAIAAQTGGQYWAPTTAQELQDAFQQISEAVQNTYEICWETQLPEGDSGDVRITYSGAMPAVIIEQQFTVPSP